MVDIDSVYCDREQKKLLIPTLRSEIKKLENRVVALQVMLDKAKYDASLINQMKNKYKRDIQMLRDENKARSTNIQSTIRMKQAEALQAIVRISQSRGLACITLDDLSKTAVLIEKGELL